MNDIIYNYIIQAILGGASGYITNDYAINMLFKEYTPLKIGGVIKKTRNEFIDNLSSLVENDIINKNKLNKILTDESFKSKFELITEDFFKNCLYEFASSDKFSDVDGIDSTMKLSGNFFMNILDKNIVEITNILFNNIKIDNFLTKTQIDKISSSLFDSINDLLNNSNMIDEFLESAYSENKRTKLIDLLEGTENKIIVGTERFVQKLNEVITSSFNDKIFDVVIDISKVTEFNESLMVVKEMLYEKPFKDIISIDESTKIYIIKLLSEYIHSNKGQQAILELCNSLFSYVKKYDKTLFELMDTSFEINLKSYLLENLPSLTQNIIDWINTNSKNIDKIIEESVDEVINEADGIKGKLLNIIKNSYLDNLSQKYNIIQKIIDYVQKETDPERLSNDISLKLVDYLNNVSISQILASAEKNNILTPSIAAKYITEYFDSDFETIFNEFFNYIMNLKLKDIMPAELYSADIIKEKAAGIILNKILSSKNISDSLCRKICMYLNNLLNKNFDELVVEESFNDKISAVKNYICNIFNKNSKHIKDMIKTEIKNNLTTKNLQSICDHFNLHDAILNEILKKYNIAMEDIKNKNLSLAVDKINSIDNLYKNSSEMLRSLMINNLDYLLEGSVKGIVTENLNRLDDDELSNLANDFIGRELKPIMYFGGILGTSAGILLALFQNGPISPETINIANMVTYSLVGFSTNAIAINMIFKPYKKVKFLSKLPFLRNFSLGYIVKNKKVFADNMSVFIDRNLLSKESINELFGKYEDSLRNGLTNSIESNDYYILNNLLKNNYENIVAGTYNFTKTLLDKNVKTLSSFAVNGIENFRFSSLLSPENIKYLSNFTKERIFNSKEEIVFFIDNKFNSTCLLKTQIPYHFVDIMKSYVNKMIEKYYDITNKNLSDLKNVKNFILKYNERYSTSINKPLKEIFESLDIKSFNNFISYRIYQMILSENSRKRAADTITNLFNKSIGSDKTFEEIFDGKLKNYINNNIPTLLDRITGYIKNSIAKSKGILSNSVQNEIKKNLGFLEKSMYSLMGGDAIVNELIDKIIDVKIPCFIDNKEDELHNIFTNIMEEKFYKIKIETLQSSINKIQISEMVDTYISNTENAEMLENKIKAAVSLLENKLEKFNLSDILKWLSLHDFNNIFDSYGKEINSLITNLSENMLRNREIVLNMIIPLINEITDEFIESTSFKDLFSHISIEDTNSIFDNLVMTMNKNNFLEQQLEKMITCYKDFINGNDKLYEFIIKDELINSVEVYIKNVINSTEAEIIIKDIYKDILKEATESNFNFIDETTKSYLLNILVKSAIESIKRNLDVLLKAIEFDRMAREEIYAMEPKKIHEMFDSFAGKYFRKLMLYGFGGFVFGINTYIGLFLSGLTAINKKIHKL
nr:DUF445 family protein [Sedimentibacter sp.]